MTVSPAEHADLKDRVGKVEDRVLRAEDRIDKVEARFDRLDGMVLLVKVILGTSLIAAVAGVASLIDLLSHRMPG